MSTSPDTQDALLEWLLQNAPVGLAVVDPQFRFVRVNERLAAFNGVAIAEHLGRTVESVVPALWPVLAPHYEAVLRGAPLVEQEVVGPAPGSEYTGHWKLQLFPLVRDDVLAGIGILVNDVSVEQRAREELRQRSDLYAMLSRTNRAIVESRSRETLFAEICRVAVEAGRFPFAWIGVPDGLRVRPVAQAGADAGYLATIEVSLDPNHPNSGGPAGRAFLSRTPVVENFLTRSDAMRPWHEDAERAGFRAAATFPLMEEDKVVALLTIYAAREGLFTPDLVETLSEMSPSLSRALDALRQEELRRHDEAELRLRDRALQAVSSGICITDARRPDHPIIFASPGFERVTGYPLNESIGRNCRFLQGPDTDSGIVAQVRAAIARGHAHTTQLLNYRRDGSTFWNELTISPVRDDSGTLTHFVGVQTDVTHRRTLELQVRQTQKMEAVGQLASGVAHDFNNLLTVIAGCSELLLDQEALPPEARELAAEIRDAGQRAGTLTRQLLAFSRRQVLAPRLLDLNDVILDSQKLLHRLIGEDVLLATQLHTPLPLVLMDPGQVEQILINLAVNARDAMPTGGALRIQTGARLITQAMDTLAVGEFVTIEVHDNGSGMDAATASQVFEPFFTTKPAGKGTGLGLATVRGILEQVGGFVEVESTVGVGTTFRCYVPRALGTPSSGVEVVPAAVPLSGSETILLVEDDEMVRGLARRILAPRGYQLIEASDGEDALSVARAFTGRIHLLLTDVVMPHRGGRSLAEALHAERPDCRIIYVSGYTDDAILRHGIIHDEVKFLQKPYTASSLLRLVRDVLDAPPGAYVDAG